MNRKVQKMAALALALMMLLSVAACGDGGKDVQTPQNTQSSAVTDPNTVNSQTTPNQPAEADYDGKLILEGQLELQYAQNFQVDLYKGGYRMIRGGANNAKLLVVPEGMKVPEELDEGVQVLQMPLTNVYAASTAIISVTKEIGALDNIKLTATDYDSWYAPAVRKQFDDGKLAYSGSYKEPDYEMITASAIQLHIDTTMIDGSPEVMDKFHELGIPSLVENSAVENHPMGRVEWVKLAGVLFGKEAEAEAFFQKAVEKFEQATAKDAFEKTVAMGYITSSGKAYARNGGDYLAQLIGLAGGDYICADMEPEKGGNTSMTFEEWFDKLSQADYLFYFNLGEKFYSLQEMMDYNPLFADFKAVKEGRVWITCPGFTQFNAEMADILTDMNAILASEGEVPETTYLIKIS